MLLILPLAGCAEPPADAARRAWLIERLTEANAIWLARDPDLLAGQYAKMSRDPYDFLRGTDPVFLADQARPVASRPPTAFLTVPEAAGALVVGDPHLENLGTCLPGPEPDAADADLDAPVTIEWVDLDAAAHGPWTVDTRRAAVALAYVTEGSDPNLAVELFARGYADEILHPSWDPAADDLADGQWVAELRARARQDGVARSELADLTTTASGPRRFVRIPIDEDGKGIADPTSDEEALLDHLLDQWPARPAGFRVLDRVRQFGKGVASYAAPRFLVAWDRGDDGPDDDRLLQVREVVDPPEQPGDQVALPPGVGRIEAATALWSRRDADVLYAGVGDGVGVYKVSTVSGWFDAFDHGDVIGDLADSSVGDLDVEGLARTVGRALAHAHAHAPDGEGRPAGPAIRADLLAGGGVDALVAERVRDARRDLRQLHTDDRLFLQALDELGPLLGADGIAP